MKFKYLTEFSTVMLWINLIAVLCIGMQFLFISQYITKYNLNYQLLSRLDQIPTSPATVFWQCAISSGLLFILIQIRHQLKLTRTNNNLLLVLEFLIAIFIFFATRMNYNGIFLLVFIDLFLSNKDLPAILQYRFWILMGIILVFVFSVSNYSFIGTRLNMPAISTYINFLPSKTASFVTFFNNFLSSLNLILFIGITVGYSLFIVDREHEVQNKLSLMSKSNRELKSYAALSEKIAKDRERKRIARDLHDTVGHALTGIATGIDAVMVLIDLDPEAAKKQLQKVSVAVKQGLTDIRRTLNQIRPDALQNYTLEASIHKMLKEYSDLSHLKIDFSYNWGDVNFEKMTELAIFRVIEESVTNALRHGHADKVKVDCLLTDNAYEIKISNNGLTAKSVKAGYGITQMKERVAIINGKFKLETEPIFVVTVDIPREGANRD